MGIIISVVGLSMILAYKSNGNYESQVEKPLHQVVYLERLDLYDSISKEISDSSQIILPKRVLPKFKGENGELNLITP